MRDRISTVEERQLTAAPTSWRGPTKQAIVDFVASATAQVHEWMKTVRQPELGVRYGCSVAWPGAGKPEHMFAQTSAVNHDDVDREFAYTKASEQSLVLAEQLDWSVVSMRNDWATVFKNDGPP